VKPDGEKSRISDPLLGEVIWEGKSITGFGFDYFSNISVAIIFWIHGYACF